MMGTRSSGTVLKAWDIPRAKLGTLPGDISGGIPGDISGAKLGTVPGTRPGTVPDSVLGSVSRETFWDLVCMISVLGMGETSMD